jgi:hypothetical protein
MPPFPERLCASINFLDIHADIFYTSSDYKMNVFGHILVFRILDTFILATNNSDRREYIHLIF